MILIDNFDQVAAQIEAERGVTKAELMEAIELALISACRRRTDETANLKAVLNPDSGEAKIYHIKLVVASVEDPINELTLAEAKKIDRAIAVGEQVEIDITPEDFGRIAAQTAKQVIVQRIREAEKRSVFDEFKDRIGEIILGTVQRVENKNYLVNLGRIEALLMPKDQIDGERFFPKDKIRVYLVDIHTTPRGPQLHISRAHPGLVRRLFELEIPEIQDGIIEVVNVARDPGRRAKVAVKSNNPAIGAVGTCVGHMGGRIQSIIKELGAEKIDILEWDENPRAFIANSLKPARISQVLITSMEDKTSVVVVPKDQLSLAIGKAGVNVRLAVKLTNWKIDIVSEEDFTEDKVVKEKIGMSLAEKLQKDKEEADRERAEKQAKDEQSSSQNALAIALSKANRRDADDDDNGAEPLKVSILAEQLGYKTKDFIELVKGFGVEIKSVRASVTPEQLAIIKEKIRS